MTVGICGKLHVLHVLFVFVCAEDVRPKSACEQQKARDERRLAMLQGEGVIVDAFLDTACNADGSYNAKQCVIGFVYMCHCVDENGQRISESFEGRRPMDCEAVRG